MGINRITKIGKSTYIPYGREFYFQNYRIISVQVSLVFYVMFCRSLFVLFFFWSLYCLSFFDLRLLVALVSSNFSYILNIYLTLRTHAACCSRHKCTFTFNAAKCWGANTELKHTIITVTQSLI